MESATKLDELMAEYEELENSTPGVNRDRLHATVQQSVQLISHVKGGTVHLTLEGLARWLKKQAFELERTHSELDTFEEAGICVAQVTHTTSLSFCHCSRGLCVYVVVAMVCRLTMKWTSRMPVAQRCN